MPSPISNDLRRRMIKSMLEEGLSCNATAKRYKVAASTAIRLKKHFITTGRYKPLKFGGWKVFKLSLHEEFIRECLSSSPDITLFELQEKLKSASINVGYGSIFRYLCHIGFSLKKRQFMLLNKTEEMFNIDANSEENIKEE